MRAVADSPAAEHFIVTGSLQRFVRRRLAIDLSSVPDLVDCDLTGRVVDFKTTR